MASREEHLTSQGVFPGIKELRDIQGTSSFLTLRKEKINLSVCFAPSLFEIILLSLDCEICSLQLHIIGFSLFIFVTMYWSTL